MKNDFFYRKTLGQHFLNNKKVIAEMIEYVNLDLNDIVLEVGSGKGALTLNLIEKAGKIIVIEKDKRLFNLLQNRLLGNKKVELFLGDIFQIELPYYNKIVSSLPYSISSKFIIWLLDKEFEIAVLLLQKEFAQKLVASPGSEQYGRISVLSGRTFKIDIKKYLPPDIFFPKPRITSSLVVLTRKKKKEKQLDQTRFNQFITALFSQKRKKLANVLQHFYNRKYVLNTSFSLSHSNIANKRVNEVSIEEFEMVAKELKLI
jgi:16S rRNA (adenine1518-N6/adenine1519-N6)-dimethyltransferase